MLCFRRNTACLRAAKAGRETSGELLQHGREDALIGFAIGHGTSPVAAALDAAVKARRVWYSQRCFCAARISKARRLVSQTSVMLRITLGWKPRCSGWCGSKQEQGRRGVGAIGVRLVARRLRDDHGPPGRDAPPWDSRNCGVRQRMGEHEGRPLGPETRR